MGDLIMVYDTETTDVWDFKAAWNAEHQPYLCQLGYKIYSRKAEVIYEIGLLVDSTKYPGWNGIAPGAFAAHGVREELLKLYGADPVKAIEEFQHWAEKCNLFIAHNFDFDKQIMQCAAYRAGLSPELFSTGRTYCTMKSTTDICKIPSPRGFGYKWPKLNEAYPFFMNGAQFSGAHNALADVNACGDIFWALCKADIVKLEGFNA